MARFERGTYRCVFLIGGFAIKVPHRPGRRWRWRLFLAGLLCNVQETDFWQEKWPQLCPIVWSGLGGLVVVMRRARPLSQDEYAAIDYREFVTRGDDYAKANFELHGNGNTISWVKEPEGLLVPAENKASSFGWLDGRVVCIDYGGCWL